jgi:hypothetical protein
MKDIRYSLKGIKERKISWGWIRKREIWREIRIQDIAEGLLIFLKILRRSLFFLVQKNKLEQQIRMGYYFLGIIHLS